MAIWLYGPQVIACYISGFAELISHVILFAATQYSGTWASASARVGGIDTKNLGSGSAIHKIEFIFFRFVNDLHLKTCKQLCKKNIHE